MQGAAAYLAGILLHDGLAFDYVPSAESPPPDFASRPYAAYVISDYPSSRLGHAAMTHIAARVEQGAGLVMIGGWESFHGRLGEYTDSPLAAVLPVSMQSCDDRRNFSQPCLIEKVAEHEILAGLPWEQPAGDRRHQRGDGQARRRNAAGRGVVFRFAHRAGLPIPSGRPSPAAGRRPARRGPDGRLGHRRSAPLGWRFRGLGRRRIIQGIGGRTIEVGNWYARFFRNLVAWAGRIDVS